MGRININTLVAAIAVTTLIVGPIMHFINPNVVEAVVSVQQQQQQKGGTFFPSTIGTEFEFEKNIHNVKAAVQQYEIKYPVLQDNNYGTWNAYGNIYWPRDYVIDNQELIRCDHVGEGGYDQTEKTIQSLRA